MKKVNIYKCKFCNKLSKTFILNTKHMKLHHKKDYNRYITHINDNNSDIKKLDATYIMNLTKEYININTYINIYDSEEDDPELTYIENNKPYGNEINNLDLFADIAISYSYSKNKL